MQVSHFWRPGGKIRLAGVALSLRGTASVARVERHARGRTYRRGGSPRVEYTTFQFLDVAPVPVYFGNVAITISHRNVPVRRQSGFLPVPNTPNTFALHTGDWTMSGGSPGTLHAALPHTRWIFSLQTTEPAVLHGGNGVIPFGPLGTHRTTIRGRHCSPVGRSSTTAFR